MYIKITQIALIIYSIIDQNSSKPLTYLIDKVKEINKEKEVIIGIAANKSDLFDEQVINTEEVKNQLMIISFYFLKLTPKIIKVLNMYFQNQLKNILIQKKKKDLEEDELILSKIIINKKEKNKNDMIMLIFRRNFEKKREK